MAASATASPGPDEPGLGQATGKGLLATVCEVHQAAPDVETTIVVPELVVDRLLSTTRSYRGPCAEYGASEPLGDGTLTAFTQRTLGKPEVIGLLATDSTFDHISTSTSTSRSAW